MTERASNESFKMLTGWMRADAHLDAPKIDDAIGIEAYGDAEREAVRFEWASPEETREFRWRFGGLGGNDVINSTEHSRRVHAVAMLAAERADEEGEELSTVLAKAKFFTHAAIMLEHLTELAWDLRDNRQQLTKYHYLMYTGAYLRGLSDDQLVSHAHGNQEKLARLLEVRDYREGESNA